MSRTGTRSLKYALETLYSNKTHRSQSYHGAVWMHNRYSFLPFPILFFHDTHVLILLTFNLYLHRHNQSTLPSKHLTHNFMIAVMRIFGYLTLK